MAKLDNPVIDFGFRPKVKSRGDELVALWNLARANAENGPACPCHGIYSGRIDPDTIEAKLDKGVLTVHAHKRPEAKPRKIRVATADKALEPGESK